MIPRSGHFRAWCAQVWRYVLQTTQAMATTEAMAGLGLAGPHTCCGPPLCPAVPGGWADCALMAAPEAWWAVAPLGWADRAHWADGSPALATEVAPRGATEPPRAFTPTEWARLRLLRDRYRASRPPFTPRELAHLRFVRWLHHTGRIRG